MTILPPFNVLVPCRRRPDDRVRQAIGALLMEVRVEAELTQAGMARIAGHPGTWISRLERGEGNLTVPALLAICAAAGTSLTEFARRLEARLGVSAIDEENGE